ncbi:3-hydroxyisobutyrate dehydrogenase [Nocardioides exalbidus]|uniref:3-hydroxyisobutyrate dehydrogenase n=1 Tax=Nocardioides exalbidus TaxID=402596 RepID=A0A1H4JXN1_9ACTN|nr:NAD(P)-dependent oxidoreductase [Nocardioides exalbidus]SEB51061.1 3-hydroxyisobutyrate dehydrogenase [Nocardioides exalbidus]
MRVTVLGTGNLGAGMARSLLREGHEVTVWNRTRERAESLAADGAVVATDAAHAVLGAEAVVTVLFDTASVLEVMSQVSLDEDCVWLQCATVGIEGATAVAELARDRGWRVLDAPVLGTKGPAEKGTLVVLASGDDEVLAAARPVTDAVGSRVVRAGDELGDASRLKLVCNAWVASLTAALGQSVALADNLGLAPALFFEAIDGGPVDAPYAHIKGAAMRSGDYDTSFAVDGVVKDLGLIRDAARGSSTDDRLLGAVLELFEAASSVGRGDDDMAAVRTAF